MKMFWLLRRRLNLFFTSQIPGNILAALARVNTLLEMFWLRGRGLKLILYPRFLETFWLRKRGLTYIYLPYSWKCSGCVDEG
jgi:hypothetical protein